MGTVPRLKTFRVMGIFESGFYEYDASLALMSLEDCKKFLNMGDAVTGIGIKVSHADRADVIADAIEAQLGYLFQGADLDGNEQESLFGTQAGKAGHVYHSY